MTNKKPLSKQAAKAADWTKIDLNMEVPSVPPGTHVATISDVNTRKNDDTLWLFVTLEPNDADGVVLGSVEDPFITIAARPGTDGVKRMQEGLARLAMYLEAVGGNTDSEINPEALEEILLGKKVKAAIRRKGTGVQVKNTIGRISAVD